MKLYRLNKKPEEIKNPYKHVSVKVYPDAVNKIRAFESGKHAVLSCLEEVDIDEALGKFLEEFEQESDEDCFDTYIVKIKKFSEYLETVYRS